MPSLVAVEAEPGPRFVAALTAAWDRGDALLPVDPRLPPPARASLLAAMRVGRPVEEGDALVMPTSGTTGEPRGAVLTHKAVRASALASSARLGVGPEDSWLSILPLSHVGGLAVVTRALVTHVPLVFKGDATLTSMVPTQLLRSDPSRFRAVLLGGQAPPADVPPNVVVTYGMTETGSGVVYDGLPLDGVEVRVDDGRIFVRGPMLLRGYRDGADPKGADGWLDTGDGGRLEDGRLHVDGRLSDLIVTGGENVWPAPVEAVLREHPQVADVAVVGRPDPEWGQRVTAVVVPAGEAPTLDGLRAFVKERLPAYAAPRELVLTNRLERTALGKLRRSSLQNRRQGAGSAGKNDQE